MTMMGLLMTSLAGCAWLRRAPRHSVSEMLAATTALTALITVMLISAGVAHADDGQLDLAGAYDTFIGSPTGNFDVYPGYLTTVEDLYLKPLGDNGTFTADTQLPTSSYGYSTSVPQGAQEIAGQIDKDYLAGDLSAAHPDVFFGFSDSSVMGSEAMTLLAADGVPSSNVDFVFVGDTADPLTGYLANPANAALLTDLGDKNLVGVTTPTDLYPTDIYTLEGKESDYWACNTCLDPEQGIHMGYMGLTLAQIDGASEVTEGLTHLFTIDTPANITAMLIDAADNVFGW